MLATYHVHSTFSDGKATVEELVAAAIEQGVAELGISDHLTLTPPPGSPPAWSMSADEAGPYVATLREVEAGWAGDGRLQLRVGIEADYFPGHEAAITAALKPLALDYVIGSVHYVDGFGIDGNPNRWKTLGPEQVDALHAGYWRNVLGMAECGLYDVAAHLDLPKKFGRLPSAEPVELIDAALDAIAAAGMVVELNTAGWHKLCADAYPSLSILKRCRVRDIAVTLSSDAHLPADLVRDFARGAAQLQAAGYDEVTRFGSRGAERWSEPIADAVTR